MFHQQNVGFLMEDHGIQLYKQLEMIVWVGYLKMLFKDIFNPSYGHSFRKNDQTNPHNRLAGKGGKWWSLKKDTGVG